MDLFDAGRLRRDRDAQRRFIALRDHRPVGARRRPFHNQRAHRDRDRRTALRDPDGHRRRQHDRVERDREPAGAQGQLSAPALRCGQRHREVMRVAVHRRRHREAAVAEADLHPLDQESIEILLVGLHERVPLPLLLRELHHPADRRKVMRRQNEGLRVRIARLRREGPSAQQLRGGHTLLVVIAIVERVEGHQPGEGLHGLALLRHGYVAPPKQREQPFPLLVAPVADGAGRELRVKAFEIGGCGGVVAASIEALTIRQPAGPPVVPVVYHRLQSVEQTNPYGRHRQRAQSEHHRDDPAGRDGAFVPPEGGTPPRRNEDYRGHTSMLSWPVSSDTLRPWLIRRSSARKAASSIFGLNSSE